MIDLQRQSWETAEQWLARLKRIEPSSLPPHTWEALTLSIGYARHVAQKARRAEGAGLAAPSGRGQGRR